MIQRTRTVVLSLVALTAGALCSPVSAATLKNTYTGMLPTTFTGSLPNEASVLEETFTLPSAGTFEAYTTSYQTGGFQGNLTLYDAHGNYIMSSGVPGSSPFGKGISDLDTYLIESGLGAGTYTLALTDNELNQSVFATNLSDGFTDNSGNGRDFIDQNGSKRTGSYSLTLAEPTASTVPEPATIWLTLPLAAAGFLVRKNFAH